MTLTTTQLAGMSDEQLIELASTDLERELADRLLSAMMANDALAKELHEATENLEVDGLDEALDDLGRLENALEEVRQSRVRLKTFIESL